MSINKDVNAMTQAADQPWEANLVTRAICAVLTGLSGCVVVWVMFDLGKPNVKYPDGPMFLLTLIFVAASAAGWLSAIAFGRKGFRGALFAVPVAAATTLVSTNLFALLFSGYILFSHVSSAAGDDATSPFGGSFFFLVVFLIAGPWSVVRRSRGFDTATSRLGLVGRHMGRSFRGPDLPPPYLKLRLSLIWSQAQTTSCNCSSCDRSPPFISGCSTLISFL